MDSSGSEDSFAWANASTDNSDFEEDNSSNINMKKERKSDEELAYSSENQKVESKKSKKAKKRKASSNESDSEYTSSKKKRIKIEPESDTSEKMVKEEDESNEVIKPSKDKKKKRLTQTDLEETVIKSEMNIDLDHSYEINESIKPKKEKKKKHRKDTDATLDMDSTVTDEKINQNGDIGHDEVKEEDESNEVIKPSKDKKKKRLTQTDLEETVIKSEMNSDLDHSYEINERIKPKKDKKKKRRKDTDATLDMDSTVTDEKINQNGDIGHDEVEEKIHIEETIITVPGTNHIVEVLEEGSKRKKKKNKDKKIVKDEDVNDSHSDIVNISAIANDITEIEHTDNELPEDSFTQNIEGHTHNESKYNNSRKLSDRLQFEDDKNDMDISMQNDSKIENGEETKMSKRMDLYIRNNKNLQVKNPKIDVNCVISNEDEVWLLRCPREIDINLLQGVSLNDDSKSKIKISGKKYEAILDEEKLQLPIFTYCIKSIKPVIKNVKLNGCFNIKRRLPKPHFPNSDVMADNQTDFIPLPETKCRHPLFGINYKKSIKVPTEIAERLKADNPVEIEEEVITKKKKNKKAKRQLELETEAEVTVSVKHEEEPVSKKKKKRKHNQVEETPVKAKRIKYDPDCGETWESEKAIEETLFNF